MHFDGERIDVRSSRSFDETIAAFEAKVPVARLATFSDLVAKHASARAVTDAVDAMTGELGFMCFAKLEQGPVVSLLGGPPHVVVYWLGNPVLANEMLEREPAAGVYAPLRASIYEAEDGTHFTYDQPSSLFEQFHDAKITEVAEALDEKMSRLAHSLV